MNHPPKNITADLAAVIRKLEDLDIDTATADEWSSITGALVRIAGDVAYHAQKHRPDATLLGVDVPVFGYQLVDMPPL